MQRGREGTGERDGENQRRCEAEAHLLGSVRFGVRGTKDRPVASGETRRIVCRINVSRMRARRDVSPRASGVVVGGGEATVSVELLH